MPPFKGHPFTNIFSTHLHTWFTSSVDLCRANMKGVISAFILLAFTSFCSSEFLNHRPFPTYSLEKMPDTDFSCRDKILGGYYADADAQCQMFHVCVKVAGIGVQDFRFLCPNGTAFDQDHQICAEWEDVDCDPSTLYYSSDNFDLYRVGSGFESKAVKYGEDEETFALQRAETGDARINKEHQAQRVNQQKEQQLKRQRAQQYERDIFKGSSSSNFYNNRNGGKENDEDYDDNVNVNQNRDEFQQKKLVRKQQRRPVSNQEPSEPTTRRPAVQNQEQQQQYNGRRVPNRRPQNPRNQEQENTARPVQNNQQNQYQQPRQNNQEQQYNQQNARPVQNNQQNARPVQNNNQQNVRPVQNNQQNIQNNQQNSRPAQNTQQNTRPVQNNQDQYNNQNQAEPQASRPVRPTVGFINNFAGSYEPTTSRPTPTNNQNTRNTYETSAPTFSTPAPFRQTQQYNNPPVRQSTTQQPIRQTDNYPTNVPKKPENYQKITKQTNNYPTQPPTSTQYNQHYDISKVKQQQPSTQNYATQTTKQQPKPSSTQFVKKPTTPVKQYDNYTPTTFAPKLAKNQATNQYYPSTFSPRTNVGYTQISQQTVQYKPAQNNNQPQQQQRNTQNFNSTPKPTTFTQYTPTVPKISPTTPVARSNRFDETQYDDGSYNPTYDNVQDEFLKTAHSQNIASSRNELAKTTKNTQSTQSSQPTPRPQYESPRPFSVSPNTPQVTQRNADQKNVTPAPQAPVQKKTKDVSYDYAYYDTNVGSEPEYEIETELKKSTVKN